jgi:hypothetical protein
MATKPFGLYMHDPETVDYHVYELIEPGNNKPFPAVPFDTQNGMLALNFMYVKQIISMIVILFDTTVCRLGYWYWSVGGISAFSIGLVQSCIL